MVRSPVLFITYTRVDSARQVWDAIKKVQPKILYFYSNRAPLDNSEQLKNNDEIRSWINEINWDCNVHTFFREKQVDVYTSTRSAMDWLFENEECGIVLEDDTVPSLALFSFHDQMLEKFKEDKRVWYIGGPNLFPEYNPHKTDYIFSCMQCGTQGWASWRDRWQSQDLDPDVNKIVAYGIYNTYFFGSKIAGKIFEDTHPNMCEVIKRTHVWDFVLRLNEIANGGLHVIPSKNLITNVGGVGASFSKPDNRTMFRPRYDVSDTYKIIVEPQFIYEDVYYDEYFFKHYYSGYLTSGYKLRQVIRKIVIRLIGEDRYKKYRHI